MTSAIRDDNIVIFCENRNLAAVKREIPDEPYAVPIGQATVLRDGSDVALIAASRMVHVASEAAEKLAADGVQAALLDLRTLAPLDVESIVSVAAKTGRVVVVDEDVPRCSISADVAAVCAEHAFEHLRAPVVRVTPPQAPVPFSTPLENAYLPNSERVVEAVRNVMELRT
jgi:pyruvate dehydrogenase E1 component beta subunit